MASKKKIGSKIVKLVALILISTLVLFLTAGRTNVSSVKAEFLNPNSTTSPKLSLEVAETQGARKVGLMYRKELAATSGMLFIFPGESERSIWMKNTFLGLDIIFLTADKVVLSISKNATPHSLDRMNSKGPAKYVVEVLAGSADKWGVVKGSKLSLNKDL